MDTLYKVFLLSRGEVEEYLPTKAERMVMPTPYAAAQGANRGYKNNCWWWLRSPGRYPNIVSRVDEYGFIRDHGDYAYYDTFSVCPAMWIELE